MTARPTTRLAPSPTGALHLGNVRTFLVNWALARQQGWRIVMRIEDLDGPRIQAGAGERALELLTWLGLDWDTEPIYQSHDLTPYRQALACLAARGWIYPCPLSRNEIAQALAHAPSAPHAEDHEIRYPGTSRPEPGRPPDPLPPETFLHPGPAAWRVVVPEGPIPLMDRFSGPHAFDVQCQVGDFILATKAGLPAYQLAVVVDDARQGVTEVVRGEDLLPSAARQILLYRLLELGPPPHYTHLPLVIGPDGRRLAKRHGDSRVSTYRQRGVGPDRIIGLIAWWCGLRSHRAPMSAPEFLQQLDLARLPRTPVIMTAEDDAWLLSS